MPPALSFLRYVHYNRSVSVKAGPIVYRLGHILLKDGSGVRQGRALSQGRRRDGVEAGSRKFLARNYV